MKKKYYLAIVIVILLISTACSRLGRRPGDIEPEAIDYHAGTKGLVLSLAKNRPPSEIWRGSDFIIEADLQNQGAYLAENILVKVYGFDPIYIQPSENQRRIEPLAGKSFGYPEGDFDSVIFEHKNIKDPLGRGTHPFTVTVEYDYGTEAVFTPCISPEINSIIKTKDKVCEVKEITSTGQGAPVAVTRVNEIPLLTEKQDQLKLDFIMEIENRGDGNVIDDIKVDGVTLSGMSLICHPNTLNLKDERNVKLNCEGIIERPTGPYISVLIIRLSYRYKSQIDSRLEIIT